MILKLLALFTIVPLIELALLIPLGIQIGLWPTIGLVLGTAILGAVLGKLEGARAWARIQQDLKEARIPGDSLLDGLAVLIAGVFLVTPGVLTDIVAIGLLIPPVRAPIRAYARKKFKKMIDTGQVGVVSGPGFSPFDAAGPTTGDDASSPDAARPYQRSPFDAQDDVIDVTPGDESDDDAQQHQPAHSHHRDQAQG